MVSAIFIDFKLSYILTRFQKASLYIMYVLRDATNKIEVKYVIKLFLSEKNNQTFEFTGQKTSKL